MLDRTKNVGASCRAGSHAECAGLEEVVPVGPELGRSPMRPEPGQSRGAAQDKRLKRPVSNRTGGPRTPQGLAVAANNSFKHGAYATQHPRHMDEYHSKLRAVVEELNPHGVIARTLCQDIAHGLAKIETLNAYEREQIYKGERDSVSLLELARRLDFPWADTHLDLLGVATNTAALQRQVLRAWKRLGVPPGDLPGPRLLCTPDLRAAALYQRGCALLSSPGLCGHAHEAFLLELDLVMMDARRGASYLGRRIAQSGDTSALVAYWLFRNAGRLQDCVREMQNERTICVLTDERLVRANAQAQRGVRESLSCIKAVRELRSVAYE